MSAPRMTPIRLPEGGRAALAFSFEGDWEQTRRAAMYGATRRNILSNWSQLPDFVRRDQGFQCLMDHYYPVDDETVHNQRSRRQEIVNDHLRQMLGSAFRSEDLEHITDEEVVAAIKAVRGQRACLDVGVPFGGLTAGSPLVTNSTTRTIVGIKTPANTAVRLWGIDIGFDGTTSTNGPGICEIDTNTWATNAPGTNSTSVTAGNLDQGRPETLQSTCAKAWTTEPTVLTTVEEFFIPSYMGSGIVFTPLTKPFVAKGGGGISMRIQQQSAVVANAAGTLKAEE